MAVYRIMSVRMQVFEAALVWSKNPIRMKSKDDGSRGPDGSDGSVTPRYITKKSPRNVRHGVLETSLTISRVFSKIEFFDYTGRIGQHTGVGFLTEDVRAL